MVRRGRVSAPAVRSKFLSFFGVLTLKEVVSGHSGNREGEVGESQEDAKNVGKCQKG